jgi:serine protease inhibitor
VNAFGFDLHRAVAEPGENTVTSPLSASVLLAMVAAGAGGFTAAEMVEVLGLEGARDTRHLRRYWPTSRAERCDVGTRQLAVGG